MTPDRYDPPKVAPALTPPGTYRWERLAEGWCPHVDHGQLGSVPELLGMGWCPDCWLGWAMVQGQPVVHLRPKPGTGVVEQPDWPAGRLT